MEHPFAFFRRLECVGQRRKRDLVAALHKDNDALQNDAECGQFVGAGRNGC
jgi:hypothetical protein